jgi:thiol-disulfide isomerase/thioredoxin
MKNKIFLTLILVLVLKVSFGQTNYYKMSGYDQLMNETAIRFGLDSLTNNLPEGYVLKPVIYNKLVKKDSVINFILFVAEKSSENKNLTNKIEFTFQQDSLYLLLDKKLPEFVLQDLTGRSFSSSELLGKPTLINFWAKYCLPCIAEIPQLNKLKGKYGDKFNFIAISESTCKPEEIRTLLKSKPFNFYQLLEGDDYKKVLKVSSLPQNIFIDKDGYIREIQAGLPCERDSKTGELSVPSNIQFVKILDQLLK